MASWRAAGTPIPPHTVETPEGQRSPQGPRPLQRGTERSHACTLPSRPVSGRWHATRSETRGSVKRNRIPQAPATCGTSPPAQTGKDASSVVGGNRLQIVEEIRSVETSCRLVPTSGPLRTSTAGVRGLRGGQGEQPPSPRNTGRAPCFPLLRRRVEASAPLRTLPRHRGAIGQGPARCPGALRAPPKSQGRQRLFPGRAPLQVAGKSQVPLDLSSERGFQSSCAPRGAPDPSCGFGPPASVTQVPRN